MGPRRALPPQRNARRGAKGSVAIGLSSLLMISISFMGMGVPLAQGDDQGTQSDDVAAQLKAAVEGTAPTVDDAVDGAADTSTETPTTTAEAPVESPAEPAVEAPEAPPVEKPVEKPATPAKKPVAPAEKPAESDESTDAAGPITPAESPEKVEDPAAEEPEPLMAPMNVDPPLMAPMAVGPVPIGTIEGQIANQAAPVSTPCHRYFPNSSNPQFQNGPTNWVTNPTEAIGSHGFSSGCGGVANNESSIIGQASAVGVVPSGVTAIAPGESFLVGAALHHNNPIPPESGGTHTGELRVKFPSVTNGTFTVPWELWETPNQTSGGERCADGGSNNQGINGNGCADRIKFNSQIADQTVVIGGVSYKLVFDGFSPPVTASCPATKPSGTQNVFWTKESAVTKSCLYASLQQVRNLTVKKVVPAPFADATSFTFDSASTLDGSPWKNKTFTLANGGTRNGELLQGETVSVTETVPTNWTLKDVQCTYTVGGGALSATDAAAITKNGNKITIGSTPANTTAGQQNITCTFTNESTLPKLTLVKKVVNDNGGTAVPTTWTLTATGPTTGISGATGSAAVTGVAVKPGTYSLAETGGPGGYDASAWSCVGGTLNGSKVTLGLGQDATCTITNDDKAAQLTLVKKVTNDDGGTATPANWKLSATKTGGTTNLTNVASGTPAATNVAVAYGTYALNETGGPSNYTWAGLTCTNNGTAIPGVGPDNKNVMIGSGDNVVCTFTNDDNKPQLSLVKSIAGADQSNATNWTLKGVGTGVNLSGAGGVPFTAVPGGTAITLSEVRNANFPNGGEFTDGDTWTCQDTANNNAGVTVTDKKVTVASGQKVQCTIVNTFKGVKPTITKTAATPTNNADGTWDITYTVRVTNPSKVVPVTYDVEDTLLFGGGATVTTATATGPGVRPEWNGTTDTAMATGQTLAAGASPAVYTVTVNATIAAGAFSSTDGNLTCAADPATRTAGGFLNAADLRVNDAVVDQAEACVAPAAPTFAKTVGTPTQQADGTWNVVYTLTASNSSSLPLFYNLSDTLGFDTTLQINTATATGPAGAIAGWNGVGSTALATGATLPAASGGSNGTHVYTVSVNVTVPVTATVDDVTCDPTGPKTGTGTYNGATLTSTGQSIPGQACVDIPLGELSIDKTIGGVSQNADGSWSVTYDVTVTNASASGTSYSLTDTLEFGAGLTPQSASWSRTAPATPALSGSWSTPATTPTTTFVTGEALAAGATHTYSVSVNATVAGGTSLPSGALCTGDDGIGGGGFLNAATVTFPGGTDTAKDCGSPSTPTVDKTFTSAVQNDDSSWTVSYSIAVDNTGGQVSYYSLTDKPGFPDGVTVNGWSVTATGTSNPDVAPWAGTQGTIRTDHMIQAGATHTYQVSFNVTIPANLPEGDTTCATGPGKGLFNATTLTSGEQTRDDNACGPIDKVGVPTLTKTAIGTSQNADGTWSINYAVTVTANPDYATRYNLNDTLRFGAGTTVESARWTWDNAPSGTAAGDAAGSWADDAVTTTIATGRVLPKGASSHVYLVTVVASVPQASIGSAALDCTLDEGETGTGFLNAATMTSGGIDTTKEACDTPTKPGIDKSGAAAVQQADGSWNVSYQLTVSNTGGRDTFYDLVDAPGFADGVSINTWNVVPGLTTPAVTVAAWPNSTIVTGRAIPADAVHVYTVTFNVDVAFTIETDALTCTTDGAGHGLFNEAQLTVNGETTVDPDCIDIPAPGKPTVAKTLGTVTQNDTGTWTITYDLTVTGDAVQVTTYTLTDTLLFGADATVDSAAWAWTDAGSGTPAAGTWTDPTGTPSTTIATDRVLAGGETDTYTVTVVASVAAGGVGSESMTCSAGAPAPSASGFLNRTNLYVGDIPVGQDEACGEPSVPTITKTFGSVAQNDDSTFDVSYSIVVDNSDGQDAVYSLTDQPGFPAGVTVLGWSVNGPDTALSGDWTAPGTIATRTAIPAGATHTYDVVFQVAIQANLPDALTECSDEGTGHGFFNAASLTSGNETRTDDDCGDIPKSGLPTVTKVATGAQQNADGSWRITYDVTVSSNADYVTQYDLTDTLRFGAGTTVTSASWTYGDDSGAWTAPATDPTTTLATGKVLAKGAAADVYTVTVVATVPQADIGSDALDCTLIEEETGTGFLNEAAMTSAGTTTYVRDCESPTTPDVTKDGARAVQLADGTWDVSYELTVSNTDGLATFYDLRDAPGFAAGVTINTWSVASGEDTPEKVIDEATFTDGTIVTGQAIAANAVHTYTVTFNVGIAVSISSEVLECTAETATSGNGFFNKAVLNVNTVDVTDIDCLDIPKVNLTIDKDVAAPTQNDDGRWMISYTITVRNTDTSATRYDLSDTLAFGGGLTPVEASWERSAPAAPALDGEWTDPAGTPTTSFVTGELINANSTHVYSVDVYATVAGGDSLPAGALCTGEDGNAGGGFLNTVDLTFPGGSDDAAACTEPTVPEVDKTFVSAMQNDDSTWTVKYDITVDNSDGENSHYTLEDTPGFPADITIVDWSVTAGADTPNPGIASQPWVAPGTIADQTAIPAGATHTYQVAFTVEIPANLPEGADECSENGAGSGFFNEATMTSGEQTRDDDACNPIEEVGVPSLTKTATGAMQNADGSWRITYDVTVGSNADFVTKYSLTDTLRFGDGVTVTAATWTHGDDSGAWTAPGTNPTTTLATNKVLAKGAAADVYTVTVTATVSQALISTTDLDCTLTEGEDGTGFLNEATMTSGNVETTRQDCATPTQPAIEKDGARAVQLGDGTWNVTYDLRVDNTGGLATFYDLTDTQGFPSGITVNTWSVVSAEGTPAVDITKEAYTDGSIVDGQAIPANTVHRYTVTFNVALSVTINSDVLECTGDGGSAGHGFFNTALLGVGDGEQSDTDCTDIPTPGTPTVEKTLGTVVQNSDGMWTVTYSLVVTGHESQVTKYTLADTLVFGEGATVESADWTWDDAGEGDTAEGAWSDPVAENTTTIATDRLLPGKATDSYTVTVVVDVAKGSVGTEAMTCGAGTEENPGRGFLNQADLYIGQTLVDEDEACGEPASVTFSKTADSLTDNEDGTFDAVYTLTVTSDATDGQSVVYSVSDTPVIPAGVELEGRTVTSEDGTVDETWNTGGTDVIAANQGIAEGETDVYTVTLTIRVTEPLTPEQRECEATEGDTSGGLLNTGMVSTGNDGYPGSDCIDLPNPSFTVDKVADDAVETEVGTWEVTYTVTVANTSQVPGTYSLSDTLRYGDGITPTAATWELLDSDPALTGAWDLAVSQDAVLATDSVLAAGDVHTYAVTVTSNVEPTVVGTTAGLCESDSEVGDRAFLNEATLTWDDESAMAEDCTEPFVNYGSLQVTKEVVGDTAGFDGGDEKVFDFTWVCTTPVEETLTGTAMLANGETAVLSTEIPVGSTCSVSETAPTGNLAGDSYGWGTPVISAESVTLTIAEPTGTVKVMNPIERRYGALTITKVVTGLGAAALDKDVVFSGTWGCMVEGGKRTGDWSITGAGSVVVADDLLIGSKCDVMENRPTVDPVKGSARYTWGATTISDAVTVVASGAELTVTNTVDKGAPIPEEGGTPPTKPGTPGTPVTPSKPGPIPNLGAGGWTDVAVAGALLVLMGSLLLAHSRRRRRTA